MLLPRFAVGRRTDVEAGEESGIHRFRFLLLLVALLLMLS
jgi:hypothetical protein